MFFTTFKLITLSIYEIIIIDNNINEEFSFIPDYVCSFYFYLIF